MITEFEASQSSTRATQRNERAYQHHEQVASIQKTFQKQVQCLVDTIETMGIHFLNPGTIYWYLTLKN